MEKVKTYLNYFTMGECLLWSFSTALILCSFFVFDGVNYLTLTASLIGVTSLIFNAKGNPFGQFLMVIFSLLYGMISYTFSYYGEMITYVGMTAPMALFSFITWMRNPYRGNKAEVKVNQLKRKEVIFMFVLTLLVTLVFYHILKVFHTNNLLPSTISVTTSFLAVYLTFRRSSYFAVAYAANDVILIVLWLMAAQSDPTYISVAICFLMFFINDLYGFINWMKIQKRQELE